MASCSGYRSMLQLEVSFLCFKTSEACWTDCQEESQQATVTLEFQTGMESIHMRLLRRLSAR